MRTGKNFLPLVAIAMMVTLPSYTFAAQVSVTTTTTVDTVQPTTLSGRAKLLPLRTLLSPGLT